MVVKTWVVTDSCGPVACRTHRLVEDDNSSRSVADEGAHMMEMDGGGSEREVDVGGGGDGGDDKVADGCVGGEGEGEVDGGGGGGDDDDDDEVEADVGDGGVDEVEEAKCGGNYLAEYA